MRSERYLWVFIEEEFNCGELHLVLDLPRMLARMIDQISEYFPEFVNIALVQGRGCQSF